MVVIATPSNTHVEFVIESLKAGKHVVCDKPLASSLQEALLMINTAKECNRHLFIFHQRRWDGDFLTLKQLIEQKELSSQGIHGVKWLEMAWQRPLSSKPWKCDTVWNGGGRFTDLAVHMIDQFLTLFSHSPVKSVYCKMLFTYSEAPQTDSHALCVIELQDQTTCVIDTNCLATVSTYCHIIILCFLI